MRNTYSYNDHEDTGAYCVADDGFRILLNRDT